MAAERLTELEDAAWRGLLLAHERIWREMEAELAPLGLTMAEYSVLGLLGEAGRSGVRLSQMAEQRKMSTGGFSRLTDRLERRDLVERRRAASDGRGFELTLTPAGRSLLRRAWRRQHADIRRLFLDRLDEHQLRSLADSWASLIDGDDD